MTKYRKKIIYKQKVVKMPSGTYRTLFYRIYKVQMRYMGLWLTIKAFNGYEGAWWANACADNLLEELYKN